MEHVPNRYGHLSKIITNTTILSFIQILEKCINFFFVIVIVRYLSQEEFGQYGFVSSYVILFGAFINLGLAGLCTREIAKKPEIGSKILTVSLVPMFFSSALTFVIIWWSVLWSKTGQTDIVKAVQLAAVALILNSFSVLFATVPRAYERMIYAVLPKFIRQLICSVLCFVLLPYGYGLVGIYYLIVLASFIELGLQIYFCTGLLGVLPTRKFDLDLCWSFIREAFPLALTSVFVIIYYKIDTVMLSYMKNDVQVGKYTAVYNLAFAFLFLGISYHQATFPALAKLYARNHKVFLNIYKNSIKYLVVGALPIATGIVLLASRMIELIYGARYIDSAAGLQILMGAFFLMFINGFMGNALIVIGAQRKLSCIIGIGMVVNVGLNLLIIPQYGFLGAAATTVFTELLVGVLCWIYLERSYNISHSLMVFFKPWIGCTVMGAFIIIFSSWTLFFIVPGAVLIYIMLLYGLKVFTLEDIALLKKLIGKKDLL